MFLDIPRGPLVSSMTLILSEEYFEAISKEPSSDLLSMTNMTSKSWKVCSSRYRMMRSM